MSLEDWKSVAEIFQAGVTGAAIVVAGFWTYRLFVRKREAAQRAKISHEISSLVLAGSQRLVHVAATVENTGQTLIRLQDGFMRIQRVLPLSEAEHATLADGTDLVPEGECEVRWPLIKQRLYNWKKGEAEIEPGETEVLPADFIIDAAVEAVFIYTYVRNVATPDREIGWCRTTLYTLVPLGELAMTDRTRVPGRLTEQTPPKPLPPSVERLTERLPPVAPHLMPKEERQMPPKVLPVEQPTIAPKVDVERPVIMPQVPPKPTPPPATPIKKV
jgi:hypothetical protein